MRWLPLAALLGCGRVAFDDRPPGVDARAPQPDLTLLLPDEAPNLVGYWRMDLDWNDAGPLGNHLVPLNGTPQFTMAHVGTASGAFYDTSLALPNRPSLEVSYLSLSAWFTSDLVSTPNSNSGHALFRISCATCGGDPQIDIAYQIHINNNGSIDASFGGAPAASVTANTWHHVVGVYEENGSRLYLDGELVFEDIAANAALQTAGGILWVGQLWPNRAPLYNPQYLHGAMDELAIWSSALSDEDARAIYANQKP